MPVPVAASGSTQGLLDLCRSYPVAVGCPAAVEALAASSAGRHSCSSVTAGVVAAVDVAAVGEAVHIDRGVAEESVDSARAAWAVSGRDR